MLKKYLNLIPIVHEKLALAYEVSAASIIYQDNGLAAAMEKALALNSLKKGYLKDNMKHIKDKLIETSVANLQAAIADVIGGYS